MTRPRVGRFWRRLAHGIGLVIVLVATLTLLYVSNFWIWRAPWGNEGLFGWSALAPGGDLLRRQLSGTPAADFHLLLWGLGSIIVLSLLSSIAERVGRLFGR